MTMTLTYLYSIQYRINVSKQALATDILTTDNVAAGGLLNEKQQIYWMDIQLDDLLAF